MRTNLTGQSAHASDKRRHKQISVATPAKRTGLATQSVPRSDFWGALAGQCRALSRGKRCIIGAGRFPLSSHLRAGDAGEGREGTSAIWVFRSRSIGCQISDLLAQRRRRNLLAGARGQISSEAVCWLVQGLQTRPAGLVWLRVSRAAVTQQWSSAILSSCLVISIGSYLFGTGF